MKHRTYILIVMLLIAVAPACSIFKHRVTSSPLVGRWQLTETLSDPGDGSGKWMPAETGSKLYIIFDTDGSVSGNGLPGTTRFAYTDSTHIALTQKGNALPVKYRYKISQNILELNPPCREACGMRYVQIK
jgi:hypothetical protein